MHTKHFDSAEEDILEDLDESTVLLGTILPFPVSHA